MIIFLVSWAVFSMVLCLALLRVIARRVPRVDEIIPTVAEISAKPEPEVLPTPEPVALVPAWQAASAFDDLVCCNFSVVTGEQQPDETELLVRLDARAS